MEDKIEFEELYKAYELCLKNKKKKIGAYNFTNEELRTCQRAKNIQYENEKNLIAKVNSQVGTLKGYNCRKLIRNYIDLLPGDAQNIIKERIKII